MTHNLPVDEKFSAFSAEQKRTIAHFVQFQHEQVDYREERWSLASDSETEDDSEEETDEYGVKREHKEIEWVLDNYWGQFL